MHYEIVNGKPPVWEDIKRVVPGAKRIDASRVYITCGTKIYAETDIPKEVLEHEKIHVHQQVAFGEKLWWEKWLSDVNFRYEQELQGYRRQIEVLSASTANRAVLFDYKKKIALILSGDAYGHIVTFNKAIQDLQKIK